MNDQIIDAVLACSLHTYACRTSHVIGWIVMRDPPNYRNKHTARLVTSVATPYLLLANTLSEIRAVLPPGLIRWNRQTADLPEVVEIWVPEQLAERHTEP